jgi:hypothetical protein
MEEENRAYRDPMAAGLREEDMEYRGEREALCSTPVRANSSD